MSFFSRTRKGWDSCPQSFVAELKNMLGDEKFMRLTEIGKKHAIFSQQFFSNTAEFTEQLPQNMGPYIYGSYGMLKLSIFLGNMANSLSNSGQEEDLIEALELAEMSVIIVPANPGARATLAILCSCFSGLQEEAKKNAKLFLTYIDQLPKIVKPPEDVVAKLQKQMQSIVDGDYSGYEWR